MFITSFIVSRNVQILKGDSKAVNVYSLLKSRQEIEKANSEYIGVFETSQYENVTLLYHPDLKPALRLINTYLKEADEDTNKLFPKVEKKPLTIRFDYDEKVFRSLYPDACYTNGFYTRENNKIYITIEDCYLNVLGLSATDFQNTLMHEYSHYKLKEYVEQNNVQLDRIPAWFNEGIADYIGFEGALELYKPQKLLPLKQLTSQRDWTAYSNKTKGQIYAQAHYAVSQLIMSKGDEVIQDILLKTKTLSFEAAFEEVMGLSLEGYEAALEVDMKNGWKRYEKMIPMFYPRDRSAIHITCLEEYSKTNPDNIDALLDLKLLYENSGDYEKAKDKLTVASEKQPKNSFIWRGLASVLENMNDFDGALKAYEKEISVNKDNFNSYISMASILLLSDTDKAAKMVNKAIKHKKSAFIVKQGREIENYIKALKNNKPYEGCLRLIKSDAVSSVSVKKALIQKVIKDYPNIKNTARTELERMKF
jgi:tetratricopeptide (TPR) repeat protein